MKRFTVLAAVALLLFTGCAGSGNALPPSGGMGKTPGAGADALHRGNLSVRIRVPKRTRRPGSRPAYVSPATQGMTIAITGPAKVSEVVGLTPSSIGCSGGPSGTSCTLSIGPLPACRTATNCYVATIATYDAVSCAATCTIPPGAHELSAAQSVGFTIAAGKANVARFTLGGIPASIAVTPLHPGYIQGDASGLKLWGPAVQQVSAIAVDADGNAIVGPGAPSISATSHDPALVVTSPSVASPNTLLLNAATGGSPAVVSPGIATLFVQAIPAAGGGSTVSSEVPIAIAHSAVYVALDSSVTVYYDGNTATPSLGIAGANTTFSSLGQLAVDASGTLYAANEATNGAILEFAAGAHGNVAPTSSISGSNTKLIYPSGLAVGNGLIYATSGGVINGIEVFAQGATGNAAPLRSISGSSTGINSPGSIALDGSQALYLANGGPNDVMEFPGGSAGNVVPSAQISGGPNFNPLGVAEDAAGTLYVSGIDGSFTNSTLETFARGADGNATPATMLTVSNASAPAGLAVDAAGTMYVGTSGNNTVYEYAPGSTGNALPIASIAVIAGTSSINSIYVVPAPNLSVVTP